MIRESANNHPTTDWGPQTGMRTKRPIPVAPFGVIHAARPMRIRIVNQPARLVLKGDRELLRALRAAEMASWDAARPAGTVELEVMPIRKPLKRLPSPLPRGATVEGWLFLVLAACAAAAACLGLGDISKLISGWTQFMHGIANLIL
jgi:hypothetical protein